MKMKMKMKMARILSSFGRREREDGRLNQHLERSLEEWAGNITAAKHISLGYIVENYFVKNLNPLHESDPIRGYDYDVTKEHLEIAKKRLEGYDVILIKEWFESNLQTQYLLDTFRGLKNFEHRNSRDAVRLAVPELTDNDRVFIKKLRERNQFDTELYNFARHLAHERLMAFKRRFLGN